MTLFQNTSKARTSGMGVVERVAEGLGPILTRRRMECGSGAIVFFLTICFSIQHELRISHLTIQERRWVEWPGRIPGVYKVVELPEKENI